jgi:hypothetical protein
MLYPPGFRPGVLSTFSVAAAARANIGQPAHSAAEPRPGRHLLAIWVGLLAGELLTALRRSPPP